MNPITIILILSIVLGVSLILNIVATVLLNKGRKEISAACQELADYDNTLQEKNKYIERINAKMTLAHNEVRDDKILIDKLKSKFEYTTEEQARLNKESEDALKEIIAGHDDEMKSQRERFEKLVSNLYDKKALIEFVKQAFKVGKANVFKLEDYIKEFKANL